MKMMNPKLVLFLLILALTAQWKKGASVMLSETCLESF